MVAWWIDEDFAVYIAGVLTKTSLTEIDLAVHYFRFQEIEKAQNIKQELAEYLTSLPQFVRFTDGKFGLKKPPGPPKEPPKPVK